MGFRSDTLEVIEINEKKELPKKSLENSIEVLPLIKSLGIAHHLIDDVPAKEMIEEDGKKVSNSQYMQWLHNDGLLVSWLLGILTEDTHSMIMGSETSKQIWNSLEEQLLPNTIEQEENLKDSLACLKKGSLSITEYIKKFKAICDNFASINKPIPETEKVFKLARGLGPKYQDFRMVMLSKPPYPSFTQFVLSLQNHEQMITEQREEEKRIVDHAQAFFGQRG
ncbi:uncharacterized protein LOC132296147 [Cornus florida]|uniref:uncharacterized protein LOC132296147 n=1 Tax=Cornus florida TaxID=4283 RepID=UPI0028A12383|nr:uncharacterized protein LOC132296147 [Cornus florida]